MIEIYGVYYQECRFLQADSNALPKPNVPSIVMVILKFKSLFIPVPPEYTGREVWIPLLFKNMNRVAKETKREKEDRHL